MNAGTFHQKCQIGWKPNRKLTKNTVRYFIINFYSLHIYNYDKTDHYIDKSY